MADSKIYECKQINGVGFEFPSHIGDRIAEGYCFAETCDGGRCEMGMKYEIYCIGSIAIEDHIGRGLLIQLGLAIRGRCDMGMHCDIYCIRPGLIAITYRNTGRVHAC